MPGLKRIEYGTTGQVEEEGGRFRVRSKDGKRAWTIQSEGADLAYVERWVQETAEEAEAVHLLMEHLQQHRREEDRKRREEARHAVMREAGVVLRWEVLHHSMKNLIDLVVDARNPDS